MSALGKAKRALQDANELDVDLSATVDTPPLYRRLLAIAEVQSQIAQAEALERIADRLTDLCEIRAESIFDKPSSGHQAVLPHPPVFYPDKDDLRCVHCGLSILDLIHIPEASK